MQHPNPPMNEEKLSQLMDGEWHDLNPSDCVAGVCENDALRAKWARYHLIRDVMKSEPVQTDDGLASRICAAIEVEESYSNITPFSASAVAPVSVAVGSQSDALAAEQTGRPSSLLNTGMIGFALAASVAVVTVVGTDLWRSQTPGVPGDSLSVATALTPTPSPTAVVADAGQGFSGQLAAPVLPEVQFVSNTGSYWVSTQTSERASDDERLNMLLSQHIENSPTAGREGMLSYSRLVGYGERSSGN